MKYHNISKDNMLNGDGLRVVLWTSGCAHKCKGCHNPITWNPNDGLDFDDSAKEEIFEQLNQNYISGITFSGGDPLHFANLSTITSFSKELKEKYPNKTIWLYTGSCWEDIITLEILNYIDVLVDGEFVEQLKDDKLMWKGSSNQRVIDVQKTLKSETPLIPVLHCEDYYES